MSIIYTHLHTTLETFVRHKIFWSGSIICLASTLRVNIRTQCERTFMLTKAAFIFIKNTVENYYYLNFK